MTELTVRNILKDQENENKINFGRLELLFDRSSSKKIINEGLSILQESISSKEACYILFLLSCLNIYRRGSVYSISTQEKIKEALASLTPENIPYFKYLLDARREKYQERDAFLSKATLTFFQRNDASDEKKASKIILTSKEIAALPGGAHFSVLSSLVKMLIACYGKNNVYYLISLNHSSADKNKATRMKSKLAEETGIIENNILTLDHNGITDILHKKILKVFCFGGTALSEDSVRHYFYSRNIETTYFKFNNGNVVDNLCDYIVGSHFSEQQLKQHKCIKFSYPTQVDKLYSSDMKNFSWQFRNGDEKNIITVGGGTRILTSFNKMKDAELKAIKSFIENNPIKWYFIGNSEIKDILVEKYGLAYEKIESLGFVDNLEDYYQSSDLVMYLPHIGGGGTGLLRASNLGIPTIAFEGGDAGMYLSPCSIFDNLHDALTRAHDVLNKKSEAEHLSKQNLSFIDNNLSIVTTSKIFLKKFPT